MRNLAFAACLVSTFFVPGALDLRASSWDKSFVMTVKEPVIAGTKVLIPGSYVWKLLDSEAERHIVQISDQKTGKVATTIIAMPTYRDSVSSKNEVQFWETPSGVPRAVRTWFYPGDNYGQEFAYPTKLVAELSAQIPNLKAAPQMAEVTPPAAHKQAKVKSAAVTQVSAVAVRQPLRQESSWATASTKAVAAPRAGAPGKRHAGFWDGLKSLPLTATLAPLIGLIGVGFLFLFGFSLLRRKNSRRRSAQPQRA